MRAHFRVGGNITNTNCSVGLIYFNVINLVMKNNVIPLYFLTSLETVELLTCTTIGKLANLCKIHSNNFLEFSSPLVSIIVYYSIKYCHMFYMIY